MELVAITLAILVLIGLAIQSFQSANLVRLFKNYQPVSLVDGALPNCAIVLCLRGCDPGLEKHVEMLIDQDYPDFHVFFVVDHRQDPALKVVNEVISRRNATNATIRVIEDCPSTCSLVANNHATLLPELASEYSVLALVDADAATWPTWLRTLVTPLVDSELSLVYGNRWYMPGKPTFAALSRFIWNYGSVQQMVFFQYPWAGSLAMKSEFARAPEFAEVLKKSYSNDTPMYLLAKSAGMQIAFHPGMMLINQEQINFKDFFYWMSRQMLVGRLYHPTWPIVLGTGIATTLVIGLSMLVNLVSIVTLNWSAFLILTTALVAYWIVWVGFVFQLDRIVARMVCDRREPQRWWSIATAIKIVFIAPCVQFVFLAGLFRASVMRRVGWRGIDYEINGPFDVRMVEYRPYGVETASDESIL